MTCFNHTEKAKAHYRIPSGTCSPGICALIICGVLCSPAAAEAIPAKALWQPEVSAVQEDIYPARHLCDNRMGTRWSSPAADPQFAIIDLGVVIPVSGMTLHWETAYAREYSVLVSTDKVHWACAYATSNGDGKTDYIYIDPVSARYIKFLFTQRATGWGCSLWEIDIHGMDEAFHVMPPADLPAGPLTDSDPETFITLPTPSTTVFDLGKIKSLGGVRIDWGNDYATALTLYASTNTRAWQEIANIEKGTGRFDLLLADAFVARYLKLYINRSVNASGLVDLTGMTLQGPNETLDDYARYRMAAMKAAPGQYPDQLRGRQVYWTITGIPDDSEESLLDEYGNVEARAKGCMLMPYLYMNNTLYSAHDASSIQQHLQDDIYPMPSVHWKLKDTTLDIDCLGWGAPGDAGTFIRYRIANHSSSIQTGTLYLAIRPLQINPVWQHGGLSPITSVGFTNSTPYPGITINGQLQYITLNRPDDFGACAFNQGDIIRYLSRGTLPEALAVENTDPLNAAAPAYHWQISPGQSHCIYLAAPLQQNPEVVWRFAQGGNHPDDAWHKNHVAMRALWHDRIHKTELQLPATDIVQTVQSQLAYILLNRDGHAIQPGSRHYERSWIRDGAMTGAALLRWGLHEPVREFIIWYSHFLTSEGMVPPSFHHTDPLDAGPGSGIEWDGQGAYISLIMDYYRFTGDRAFLDAWFDQMVKAMHFLQTLRERTLLKDYCAAEKAPERFRGILPKSFSHEGYYPEMHSYWDDFWALKGWHDGAEAARILDKPDIAAWAEEQYTLLADAVAASIRATIDLKAIHHIPGCAEKGDFDPTSTSITFFPCSTAQSLLPKAPLHAMYDRYYAELQKRRSPDWQAGFTPYEIRNVPAFIGLEQYERAHALLDMLMKNRRPAAWNHWAEVIWSKKRMGCYIGDMPHTWVGSGFLNAIALMLAKTRNGQIILLDGIPASWLSGSGITLKDRPTPFGTLNLDAYIKDDTVHIKLSGSAAPPNGFCIRLPTAYTHYSVRVNGTAFSPQQCIMVTTIQ